jgi:superfamily II DNA/RNA helicase
MLKCSVARFNGRSRTDNVLLDSEEAKRTHGRYQHYAGLRQVSTYLIITFSREGKILDLGRWEFDLTAHHDEISLTVIESYVRQITPPARSALRSRGTDLERQFFVTESGAEGINLQFCSLVVNYDLPWNPQRVEQRIGRCHRYGQKIDVTVVNFLNLKNRPEQRVYELLSERACWEHLLKNERRERPNIGFLIMNSYR